MFAAKMGDQDPGSAAANGAGNEDDRKLFIGGLAQEVGEPDLKEYFGKFGVVTAATLKMDPITGRSRGFAFVVFQDVEPLEQVLNAEHTIKNKKVMLVSRPRDDKCLTKNVSLGRRKEGCIKARQDLRRKIYWGHN